MTHAVQKDVEEALKPYRDRIRGVVQKAWDEWRAMAAFRADNNYAPLLYSRTVANLVFDAIARHAVAEFGADPSVHIKIESQTIKLFFKGSVFARFKKGDEDGLGQNIPTNAALAFEDADGVLPGLPAKTAKVEFIWLANELFTRLEHVMVVARDGDHMLWSYEIDDAGAGGGAIAPFPSAPSAPPSPDDGGLITPKKSKVKKPRQDNG